MARRKRNGPDDAELRDLYEKFDGNFQAIADHLQRPRSTIQHWYKRQLNMPAQGTPGNGAREKAAEKFAERTYELPELPDGKVTPELAMDYLTEHFIKQQEHRKARKWLPIKIKYPGPIAVAFIGDPHLADNGCNLPLLRHHAKLLSETEGMYAVNIGDTVNNWLSGSRLEKLYAHQDSSKSTERLLAEWFLNKSGIDWIVWLMGNHDMWGEFAEILRAYNINSVPMEDWQAQFKLCLPNGREVKIWAAHDFKGHSMWNSLHGPQKAAHLKESCNIYACGHTHNWALHHEESASRDFAYWLIRSRGYKFIDEYAELLGHFPQQEGASITAVIDPDSESEAGFVTCFADMDKAVMYLKALRGT